MSGQLLKIAIVPVDSLTPYITINLKYAFHPHRCIKSKLPNHGKSRKNFSELFNLPRGHSDIETTLNQRETITLKQRSILV